MRVTGTKYTENIADMIETSKLPLIKNNYTIKCNYFKNDNANGIYSACRDTENTKQETFIRTKNKKVAKYDSENNKHSNVKKLRIAPYSRYWVC